MKQLNLKGKKIGRLILALSLMAMGYGCAFKSQEISELEEVLQISDQNRLSEIAINDAKPGKRKAAIEKISNPVLLLKVALLSDEESAHAAIAKISDQGMLAKYIIQNKYKLISKPMTEKITDQTALAEIALKAYDSESGKIAMDKLTDQPTLAGLIREKDLPEEMRIIAVKKMDDQKLLAKLITEGDIDLASQEVIFRKINDPGLLLNIALLTRSGNMKIGVNAAQQISDPSDLLKIVLEAKNVIVRRVAYLKLSDQTLLSRLAKEHNDPAVRIATLLRLGRTTWKEVLSQTTQNKLYSGDVIGAMVLSYSTPAIKDSLLPILSAYFKKGDPARIPELVFLLSLYGTKALAEDYLYCGNDELRSAGEKWLQSNGQKTHISGKAKVSHRLSWGRKK